MISIPSHSLIIGFWLHVTRPISNTISLRICYCSKSLVFLLRSTSKHQNVKKTTKHMLYSTDDTRHQSQHECRSKLDAQTSTILLGHLLHNPMYQCSQPRSIARHLWLACTNSITKKVKVLASKICFKSQATNYADASTTCLFDSANPRTPLQNSDLPRRLNVNKLCEEQLLRTWLQSVQIACCDAMGGVK